MDEFDLTYESPEPKEPVAPALVYRDPVDFFVQILARCYVRDVNGGSEFVWCPRWYVHPEALARMETIWRAWEHLRQDPALGLSTWWLQHADPHMAVLMAKNGPFKKCAYDGHEQPTDIEAALPHIEPPSGLFPEAHVAMQRTDLSHGRG